MLNIREHSSSRFGYVWCSRCFNFTSVASGVLFSYAFIWYFVSFIFATLKEPCETRVIKLSQKLSILVLTGDIYFSDTVRLSSIVLAVSFAYVTNIAWIRLRLIWCVTLTIVWRNLFTAQKSTKCKNQNHLFISTDWCSYSNHNWSPGNASSNQISVCEIFCRN